MLGVVVNSTVNLRLGNSCAHLFSLSGPKLMSVCFKAMPAHLKKLQNIDHEKLSYSWQLGTNEKQKNTGLCYGLDFTFHSMD